MHLHGPNGLGLNRYQALLTLTSEDSQVVCLFALFSSGQGWNVGPDSSETIIVFQSWTERVTVVLGGASYILYVYVYIYILL